MKFSLNTLRPKKGSTAKKKRVGRGLSSTGTYSGRGIKGQKARAGASGSKKRGLRQLMLATPKLRGFKSPNKKSNVVTLGMLSDAYADGAIVTPQNLQKKGLVRHARDGVKILVGGTFGKKLTIKNCAVSKQAHELIETAGGSVEKSA